MPASLALNVAKDRVLVLGGSGALGGAFIEAFKGRGEIIAPDHSDVDIAVQTDVANLLSRIQPQIIINCAAFTDVDKAEEDRENCWRTNVVGVKNICTNLQPWTQYLHFSTLSIQRFHLADHFRPRQEANWYNYTKKQGERVAKARARAHSNTWIFRPYWLWGDDSGFAPFFLNRLLSGKEVVAVADVWGPVSYTRDVVSAVHRIIESKPKGGTFQTTFSGMTSPHEFARFLALKIGADPNLVVPTTASEWFPSAQRPRVVRSMMSHRGRENRHWNHGVDDWLGAMKDGRATYSE